MSDIPIIDKVSTLVFSYQRTFNTKPKWLIVDYTTYKEIQALAEYWPSYILKEPKESDRFYGLGIAISTGNIKTIEVK